MRVITISGLDGSGKSTQVESLRAYLERQGETVFAFHAIQFSVVQRLRNAVRRLRGRPARGGEAEGAAITRASAAGIAVRRAAFPVDRWRYRRLLASLRRRGVTVVLSDRYFYDTLVNIAYLSRATAVSATRLPRPDVAVYLRCTPEAIVRRSRVPEQGRAYLEAKFALYDDLAGARGLETVDGDQPPAKVRAAIRAIVDA